MPRAYWEPQVQRKWGMAAPFAVAGTGRVSRGRYLRNPKCGAVRRGLLAIAGTLRGEKYPPSAWDDIPRSNARDRTWKRHRAKQWREIEV